MQTSTERRTDERESAYRPPRRSTKHIYCVPDHVYAGVGGFEKVDALYKHWREIDKA